REYILERNPVWDSSKDDLRPAYVDQIQIQLGADTELVQLQLEAGVADLGFGHLPPVAELAALLETRDPNVVLVPPGDRFGRFVYIVFNMAPANDSAPLKRLEVRQAIELAVDKTALVQDYGGPSVARAIRQASMNTAAGFRSGADHYVTPGDRG